MPQDPLQADAWKAPVWVHVVHSPSNPRETKIIIENPAMGQHQS